MNILYLCDEYPPGRHGGIGTIVQLLAREMVKLGHNVVVAGFYDWGYGEQDNFDDEGVKVYRFRRGLATKLFSNTSALAVRGVYKLLNITGVFEQDIHKSLKRYKVFLDQLIEQYDIDIVETPDYLDYMRFCRSYTPFPVLDIPMVVRLHGAITYFMKEAGENVPGYIWQTDKNLLETASGVCSVSQYTADKVARYMDYNKDIRVIYNGIDVRQYETGTHKIRYKVVFSGTLVAKKGIYSLLEAWNLVHEKLPDAMLYIYGKGPVEKIQRLLSSDALRSVKFMGHVSRKELILSLSEASIGVFPSYAETFGLAPVEAMAAGTAVIFTTRTSGPEIVDDKINGLLVDPDDTNKLADAILYLLENMAVCDLYAAKGQQKVKEQFDISVCARQTQQYYNDVLNSKKIKL